MQTAYFAAHHNISIHAPRVGSDLFALAQTFYHIPFQSTLPVWGATSITPPFHFTRTYFNPRSPCGERPRRAATWRPSSNFNPRSPCGERLLEIYGCTKEPNISIHAPRVGSDLLLTLVVMCMSCVFQSTLPVWGATLGGRRMQINVRISIHAPRVGSDSVSEFVARLF